MYVESMLHFYSMRTAQPTVPSAVSPPQRWVPMTRRACALLSEDLGSGVWASMSLVTHSCCPPHQALCVLSAFQPERKSEASHSLGVRRRMASSPATPQ